MLRALTRLALDALFPPHCASCDAAVDTAGNICTACFAQLRVIADPICTCCGVPFANPVDTGLCAVCVDEAPPFARARSVWVYNEISAALVTRFKFTDRTAMLPRYGHELARAGAELLAATDVIVPVPLHWRRLMARRYNQSALLAFALSARTGVPVDVRSLRRVRHTIPQTRLKGADRRSNVKGAFAVRGEALRGKRVLLLDDVMTTGATIHACITALEKAGAREVAVLTLARTVRE